MKTIHRQSVTPHAMVRLAALMVALVACRAHAETVALWLFDEQADLAPSCVLGDAASGDFPLVLGPGGIIVEGKFGNALAPVEQPPVEYPENMRFSDSSNRPIFGLHPMEDQLAMTWANANFAGLMTRGEQHLRQEVNFASPTGSDLNLGESDWTVEFWYLPVERVDREGVVFEVGSGPRGTNDACTRLLLNREASGFVLVNEPSDLRLQIPSSRDRLDANQSRWRHLAFVYDASDEQLRHFVDGKLQDLPPKCRLKRLPSGTEDYLSLGRDRLWKRPLPGRLDELRVSNDPLYKTNFTPPGSFSRYGPDYKPPELQAGPPLLFNDPEDRREPTPLGSRKHLFIDDALLARQDNVTFTVNPPRLAECVVRRRGVPTHIAVFEDTVAGDGLVRLYMERGGKGLEVWTSADGVEFEAPDLQHDMRGPPNLVIDEPVGLGTIFVDPNGPDDERIKYFSGYRGRGCYLYSSPDGYRFTRNETSSVPFRAASQSLIYYDDQRQRYVGFHRSDMLRTVGGKTSRSSVRTETVDLMRPWPYRRVTQADQAEEATRRDLGRKNPYYIDNGPLTPPGFGIEFPTGFARDSDLDPVGVDVYVPKCIKYPWAADVYLAFPIMYFHYHGDGPEARQALGTPTADRGSGPLETQLAVSRDGVRWRRYPRPAYIGIGKHAGIDLKKVYIGHGMVRRGSEIWQYYVGSDQYHSPWTRKRDKQEAVFRVIQRFDGFVSADTPYEGGELTTRPLTFTGKNLVLNIDTDATGYAQVGLLDAQGQFIPGYNLDDCVYINGDFLDAVVHWKDQGADVSNLSGQTVQLVIRSRGSKLYSLQFQ